MLSYIGDSGKREYFYDGSGSKVRADVDSVGLRKIAEMTGGRYFYGGDAKGLSEIFADLSHMIDSPQVYERSLVEISVLPFFFFIIIILTLAHASIALLVWKIYKIR